MARVRLGLGPGFERRSGVPVDGLALSCEAAVLQDVAPHRARLARNLRVEHLTSRARADGRRVLGGLALPLRRGLLRRLRVKGVLLMPPPAAAAAAVGFSPNLVPGHSQKAMLPPFSPSAAIVAVGMPSISISASSAIALLW